MDSRREFLRKSLLLSGAAGLSTAVPASIRRALEINPAPGSSFEDAEHIVILMQENRSFDHCFGTLRGVRGFNDPRAVRLPDQKPVWFQTDEKGDTYAPFRLNIHETKSTWMGDLPHSRASQVDAYHEGKYDQWLLSKKSSNKKYSELPLTLGYYTREDLPFHYAMADAFTVCDQNFCSAMTSTTPNRSFFWTGKITADENGIPKAHIRNDDFSHAKLHWKTFPELLEENGVAWKFYQNEISCGGGFKGEERSWLSNFGCNLLEFFAAFNVKFTPRYVKSLENQVATLPGQINKLQEASPSTEEAAQKIKADVFKKQEALDKAKAELTQWNQVKFAQLPEKEKSLHRRAFVTNTGDPAYRQVSTMRYSDEGKQQEVTVPAGDLLHQFRKDVDGSQLPTVSWLAGPQNFSDHPSAPWYGAWYVSEILDILTKNPEVWKKTIFIVTYDENDGYYDHIPPFSIPDNNKPGTGKCSAGIDTEVEHVRLAHELQQGIAARQAREAPIGLGFRVPMLIASPWSRGGKVCSQVFDHTSTLQFLETFIQKKYKKQVAMENISRWRRTICGDLTAAFSPFNDKQADAIPFLEQHAFVEQIHQAKFKPEPNGFHRLTQGEIKEVIQEPAAARKFATQEKGTRISCALPYELYADGYWDAARQAFEIKMAAGNSVFGKAAVGAPFTVAAPGAFTDEKGTDTGRNWWFAVTAGDSLSYQWPAAAFEKKQYELCVHGPNGFYRGFKGSSHNPAVIIAISYQRDMLTKKPTGALLISTRNEGSPVTMVITDQAYQKKTLSKKLAAGSNELVLDLQSSGGWYDFSVTIAEAPGFEQRYAGRVETGKEGTSDPAMG